MNKIFLLIIILSGLISCKTKENHSEKVRLSENVLQNIPRDVLTTPFNRLIERQLAEMRVYMDSSAYAQKGEPLSKKLDSALLRQKADSLFIHLVDWDSLKSYPLKGSGFPASLNPAVYHPADRRLLAMAMDIQHDSLLQACSREWKSYFKTLENVYIKGQRRLFKKMIRLHQAWNPRNRHLKEADIEFVVSTESARFIKGLQNGYVVAILSQLQENKQLKNGCTMLKAKGLAYYSRVYLSAFSAVLEKRLNGVTGSL